MNMIEEMMEVISAVLTELLSKDLRQQVSISSGPSSDNVWNTQG